MDPSRTVICPSCSTEYAMPESLLGPGGAEITCPTCGGTFVVLRETAGASPGEGESIQQAPGETQADTAPQDAPVAEPQRGPGEGPVPAAPTGEAPAPQDAPASEGPPPAPASAQPASGEATDAPGIARELLDGFAEGREAEVAAAARDGRLFATFGADLMQLFDAYRARVGKGADPAPFRNLLRERWGVELARRPEPGEAG